MEGKAEGLLREVKEVMVMKEVTGTKEVIITPVTEVVI
jgi:hypothetical protein